MTATAVHPAQLVLALDELLLDAVPVLAGGLRDRRRQPRTGPARLMRALVLRGLEPEALIPAAALVIELERDAIEARESAGEDGDEQR